MNNMQKMAIKFWEEVNELWPTENIQKWIKRLHENDVDWFRGGGLAMDALMEHSFVDGRYSQKLHGENMEKFLELVGKYENLHLVV